MFELQLELEEVLEHHPPMPSLSGEQQKTATVYSSDIVDEVLKYRGYQFKKFTEVVAVNQTVVVNLEVLDFDEGGFANP